MTTQKIQKSIAQKETYELKWNSKIYLVNPLPPSKGREGGSENQKTGQINPSSKLMYLNGL